MFLKKAFFPLLLLGLGWFLLQNNVLGSQNLAAHRDESEYLTSREGVVLCFDLDDVISGKEKIGAAEYASLIPKLVWQSPKIITALWPKNFKAIRKKAGEIGATTNGTSNIIHKTVEWLKTQGYGDLACYEGEFVERSLQPFIARPMIATIEQLKQQGYVVIGATNQDYGQYQVYHKKMKQLGVDLTKLFNAVLVTRVDHEKLVGDDPFIAEAQEFEGVYVVRKAQVCKPSTDYFKALEVLVHLLVPAYTTIIFTDDSSKNVQGAIAAGLKGIHFKLPGDKMRGVPASEVLNTFNQWKKEMTALGVSL